MFVLAYLLAMGGIARRSLSAITAVRAAVIATLTTATGSNVLPLASADLSNIAWWLLVGVGVWLVVEFLVLAPARYWRDQQQPPAEPPPPSVVNNIFVFPINPTSEPTTSAGTAIPADPQSPERSTHDQ